MTELLRIENLHTWFHTRTGVIKAVDGVSLSVEHGRTLGVVGESGSGKSLTALSIMGLVDAPGRIQPGSRILLEGRDLVPLREKELLAVRGSQISMIFQEPMSSLNPVFTIGAQIEEAIRLHEQVSAHDAHARAIEMLRLVGIPEPELRARHFPHQLSGGMLQRVMIAMAMSCNPKLLIADEPTTALDVTIQAQILELMRVLREKTGMSAIIITHDLRVIAEVADDVAVMYAGQVVEFGPVTEVLRHPKHPYTSALMRSIPVLGMTQDKPLHVIPGTVPDPRAWPAGCRFAPRCEYAFDRCLTDSPPVFVVGEQRAACWLCEAGTGAPPQALVK